MCHTVLGPHSSSTCWMQDGEDQEKQVGGFKYFSTQERKSSLSEEEGRVQESKIHADVLTFVLFVQFIMMVYQCPHSVLPSKMGRIYKPFLLHLALLELNNLPKSIQRKREDESLWIKVAK